MDEASKLRLLLQEEQRRRREAEGRASEEQRRREEEQRRREEEQRRREEEQRRREEEQRRREEEQRRREEEQRRREEEQHQRKKAEELVKASQPQTLQQYMEACHSLSLAIQVVIDPSSTTKGEPVRPTGRLFPERILPWLDFAAKQEEIWEKILDDSFCSQPIFPSLHQLQYVESCISPISGENGLRYFERDTVENAVQRLVSEAYNNPRLRSKLGLKGTIIFESHTNFGPDILETREELSIGGSDPGPAAPVSRTPLPRPRPKARGKGGRADQFCIYRTSDGENFAALAIEYKAPHKLSLDEITTGLEAEIQPERDVINKDGNGFVFASKWLTAAVVTQLFSYMINKSVQYGYVCTGKAFIFLHIPDDPTMVYQAVCVPNLDVVDDDGDRFFRTAVAQVFAFVIQGLLAAPPLLSWHDAANKLKTWDAEVDNVLSRIPVTDRKKSPLASPYKPQRWKGFTRSPIMTRSFCKQLDTIIGPWTDDENDNDDNNENPPSPTAHRSTRSGKKVIASSSGKGSAGKQGQSSGGHQQQAQGKRQKVEDRPFCTQQCLVGLANGGPMDKDCPNFDHHGQRHVDRLEFLRLIRAQLAKDRGPDADSAPLHLSGSRGSLFKVRLSSHGYTLVAKGMESFHLGHLQHEKEIYDQLQTIQGTHVPVCLGMIDLVLPHYYDGGVFQHFLFLSWAGRPLLRCASQVNKAGLVDTVTIALKELHRLRILHRDAELRNFVYDLNTDKIMLLDFERAEFRDCQRQPLGPVSLDSQGRKKKTKRALEKQGKDDYANCFDTELQCAVSHVTRYLDRAMA